MAVYINPGIVSGNVHVPSSKSLSHRALLCALLSDGETIIEDLCICDDVIATLNIIKDLGKKVEVKNNIYYISGSVNKTNKTLFANESGSTLRFIIPILSLFEGEHKITGSSKLMSRPLEIYKKIFMEQGIIFDLTNDILTINGKLSSGEYEIPGNISSQFITGLMYALPMMNGDSTIKITGNYESKSYVNLTIDVLSKFGIEIVEKSYNEYYIKGNQKYKSCVYKCSGDYSQMAFWAVLGTINSDITISGMEKNSLQGDRQIVDILDKFASNICYKDGIYYVSKSKVKALDIDLSDIPDLGPILGVLSACTKGISKIRNCQRLKYKESDRLEAIREELVKMNVDISIEDDMIVINPINEINNSDIINSHNDHRIFMALAVLGTVSKNGVRIDDEKCINKSYPLFLKDLEGLGIKVEYK